MNIVIRILMWFFIGIPMIIFNAWVFGQKLWPYFAHPIAPTLFVEKLSITNAIGFALINAWLLVGIARLVYTRTEATDEDDVKVSVEGYVSGFIFTLIIWGVAEFIHWLQ